MAARETPAASAAFLVGYTAVLAVFLLLATGSFAVFPRPRAAPPHVTLLWELADWAAVSVCLAADAYFVYCIASHRRSKKAAAAPAPAPSPADGSLLGLGQADPPRHHQGVSITLPSHLAASASFLHYLCYSSYDFASFCA
uniref:Uncharacterized protein n=1 Tax=Oryza brachyantha TaxID=4533 RepID=J3MJI7_ORYBR